jgi:Xaa-Pro aminopeptidase
MTLATQGSSSARRIAGIAPRASIPDDELRLRPRALGRALAEAGFDAWIAYGDDRAVAGPDHIRFLVDLAPHFEPVLIAARVDEARPVVLTGPETVGYAEVVTARASVEDILAIAELAHPDEEYPTIPAIDGFARLEEICAGARRIAVLSAGAVPFPVWQELIAPLAVDNTTIASGDAVAYALRAVKTAAEQAVIDEAYRIARCGLEAAVAAIRPGATEREVVAAAEGVMRAEGAEGFGIDTMVASGVANTAPILARSTFREIRPEDLVSVTVAPRYEGYHAALARPFLFRPDHEIEYAIATARLGQRAAVEHFRVGAKGRDSAKAVRDLFDAASTGAELPYVPVHSIGVIEFEPPIFDSNSNSEVEEGMALSIDAALFHARWGGLRIEDGFSIRSGGIAEPRFPDYETMVPVFL